MTTDNPQLKRLEEMLGGEGLTVEALKQFPPELVYQAVEKRIIELENKNYADPKAIKLQRWLGDFTIAVWGGCS